MTSRSLFCTPRALIAALLLVGVVHTGTTSSGGASASVSKGKPISFQAEVSKMLDILINSLYTNRAVFLRELISNGSDALDKIRLLYLTAPKEPVNKDGVAPTLDIRLSIDREARTLTLRDGGIGMTRKELESNLGSLGSSGTKRFMEKLKESKDSTNLIGQFGVGFYSAFLVADRVRVASKSDESDTQWVWESAADGQYYVYEDERGNTLGRGTEITLQLKPDALEFMDGENLRKIVHQYSQFVHFPIRLVRGNESDVLNENQPIWTRKPSDVTHDEYVKFYKGLTRDYRAPMYYSHFKVEGEVEFSSVLFVPEEATQDIFMNNENTRDNIKLYVRRIFITDEFRELLPRYLNFVRGVVDSNDLPLNVSREVLQESRILRVIKKKLVRKALGMIAEIATRDVKLGEEATAKMNETNATGSPSSSGAKGPLYPRFWAQFGKHIRLGILEDANNRGRLAKLLRYVSSKSNGTLISLQEYTERMQPNQKNIYYLTGDSVEKLMQSPHMEEASMRGVEVLFMTDAIDEYVVSQVHDFANKKLVNLATDGAQLEEQTDKEKAIDKKRNEKFKPLTDLLARLFKGNDVRKVVLTKRRSSEPFILSSQENEMTARMVNILKQQAISSSLPVRYTRVLEVNYRHPIVHDLLKRFKVDANDQLALDIAWVLFGTASIQAEFPVPDQAMYAKRVSRLLRGRMSLPLDDALLPPDDDEYDVKGAKPAIVDDGEAVLLPVDGEEGNATGSASASEGTSGKRSDVQQGKPGTPKTGAGDL
ncbi:putative Histidine kinase DNA gyrase B and HSP90 like ATPase Hsp90 protein [Trypanosoma vivax]|uniref:Putative heat shock protein 90 n=1 Tax=Trypanosoma vivax (strain Y486) TaxID=1055687 RepID=G0TT31_TRYVY|nr:putative Histidine kinase DNA gyrase B and HSP90 like ATPase Hsp90 protein [Trypanosoma vivax]CCC47112.1 putative heat shock protein 90 [Trypanosoma vivax Y486]